MESLGSPELVEVIKSFFGDAMSSEFVRTLAIFSAAAFVHGRQVRKEIKAQVGALIVVLEADLKGQKKMTEHLYDRVEKLEGHFIATIVKP